MQNNKNTSPKSPIKILSLVLFSVLFTFLILGIKAFKTGYDLLTYKPDLSTQLFDKNGEILYQIYGDKNRVWVPVDDMPADLKDAAVALEDHRFYEHFGVDFAAIARAAKSTYFEGDLEGGSTITQQFIKNAYLTSERTYSRKIKEAYLALILETFQSKDEILEKYLNEIGFGGVYYGVGSASRFYFNKDVSELTLAQAAGLMALTKAPTNLSPRTNLQEFNSRKNLVLEKMFEYGYISQEEKEQAAAEDLQFAFAEIPFRAPHFSLYVKDLLIKEYGEEKVLKGGLQVTTTLDYSLQQGAEEALLQELDKVKGFNVTNGAIVALEPKSGGILVMVGSKDYSSDENSGKFNAATAFRQPGSTFKPFTYALAFEKGYSPATVLKDVPTQFIGGDKPYKPVNYDGAYHGQVSIRQALASSYNIPAVRMLAALGVDKLLNETQKLGFDYIESSKTGLSLTLGANDVRLLDLTAAYGSFANMGNFVKAFPYFKINDSFGKEVYAHKVESNSVFSAEASYLISDILADNSARAAAFGTNSQLAFSNNKVAVKTGTSDDKRDNWAVGYTPSFVIGVWVGNNDFTPMSGVASGLTGASSIWRKVTDSFLSYGNPGWFEQPARVVKAVVEKSSGLKYCNSGQPGEELFIFGSEPEECGRGSAYVLYERVGEDRVKVAEVDIDVYNHFLAYPDQFKGEFSAQYFGSGQSRDLFVEREGLEPDPLELAFEGRVGEVAGVSTIKN